MNSIKKELKELPVVKAPKSLDARIHSMFARASVSEHPRSWAMKANLWIYLVSCALFLIVGYALRLFTLSETSQNDGDNTHIGDHFLDDPVEQSNAVMQTDPFRNEWQEIHTWVGK